MDWRSRTVRGLDSGDSIRSMSSRTAAEPMSKAGWRTVVMRGLEQVGVVVPVEGREGDVVRESTVPRRRSPAVRPWRAVCCRRRRPRCRGRRAPQSPPDRNASKSAPVRIMLLFLGQAGVAQAVEEPVETLAQGRHAECRRRRTRNRRCPAAVRCPMRRRIVSRLSAPTWSNGRSRVEAVEQDDRRLLPGEGVQEARGGTGGAREDETVDAAIEQRAHGALLAFGVFGGVRQQQRESLFGRSVLDAVGHLGERRLAGVGDAPGRCCRCGIAASPWRACPAGTPSSRWRPARVAAFRARRCACRSAHATPSRSTPSRASRHPPWSPSTTSDSVPSLWSCLRKRSARASDAETPRNSAPERAFARRRKPVTVAMHEQTFRWRISPSAPPSERAARPRKDDGDRFHAAERHARRPDPRSTGAHRPRVELRPDRPQSRQLDHHARRGADARRHRGPGLHHAHLDDPVVPHPARAPGRSTRTWSACRCSRSTTRSA